MTTIPGQLQPAAHCVRARPTTAAARQSAYTAARKSCCSGLQGKHACYACQLQSSPSTTRSSKPRHSTGAKMPPPADRQEAAGCCGGSLLGGCRSLCLGGTPHPHCQPPPAASKSDLCCGCQVATDSPQSPRPAARYCGGIQGDKILSQATRFAGGGNGWARSTAQQLGDSSASACDPRSVRLSLLPPAIRFGSFPERPHLATAIWAPNAQAPSCRRGSWLQLRVSASSGRLGWQRQQASPASAEAAADPLPPPRLPPCAILHWQ